MSQQAQQQSRVSFRWQLNWKVLLFTAFFLPVTVNLAIWQLNRAEEKQQLLEDYQQRDVAQPVALVSLGGQPDKQYVRVRVRGEYDNRSPLLLDNRVRHGRPGFEVISLFQTLTGQWLLVNRGWLQGSMDRTELPPIDDVVGEVELTGYLYQSPGEQIMLGEDRWAVEDGPKIIQNAAPEKVAEKLSIPIYSYTLRLDDQQPGAYETGWDVVNLMPGKHTGYAVQWTALAIALVVLTVFANSNLGAVIKSRRRQQIREEG
ncbi:SURF1 family protein [Porticoccus litoralis]|jgi:cytochrome oxidase assembly protein ShyY1|uniref:SURF1-like protein n=1 Tax=Porticoccus litoralis TaxID=434086 RepID=A0AAW8B375_9GAMM|nr:SURF1 family protein [Porticoccus litoralis]MDP1520803.1 SURF1 family protein [Porticoccus litoralis]